MQVPRGDVNPQLRAGRQNIFQDCGIPGDQFEQMLGEGNDQILRFGKTDKSIRRNIASCRMRPAHEHFNSGNLLIFGIDHRLVNHIKLMVLDGREDLFPRS